MVDEGFELVNRDWRLLDHLGDLAQVLVLVHKLQENEPVDM